MSYRRSPKRSRHSRSHSRSRTRDRDYRDDRRNDRRDDRDYRDRGSSKQPSTKHSDEDQSKISTQDCLNIYFIVNVCLSFPLSVFRLPSICPKTSFNSCSRMYHKMSLCIKSLQFGMFRVQTLERVKNFDVYVWLPQIQALGSTGHSGSLMDQLLRH